VIGFSDSAALGRGGGPSPVYVLIPYVGLLLPLGLSFARALLLVFKSRPLEYAEYDKYLVQQKGMLLSALIISGVLLVGMIAFLILHADNRRHSYSHSLNPPSVRVVYFSRFGSIIHYPNRFLLTNLVVFDMIYDNSYDLAISFFMHIP
jgi:hypothetical protein